MESVRFYRTRRVQNKRQLGQPFPFLQHDSCKVIRKPEKPRQLQRFTTALFPMQMLDCEFEIFVNSHQPSLADGYQSLERQLLGSQSQWQRFVEITELRRYGSKRNFEVNGL